MEKTFETTGPVELHVEIQSGEVSVTATESTTAHVAVAGERAEEVRVEHRGDRLVVLGPRSRSGPFGANGDLVVQIAVPDDSVLSVRTGSADLDVRGRFAAGGLKAGSGRLRIEEVTGDLTAETGSGDVVVDVVGGEARLRTGSGDLSVESLGGGSVSTGSGDLVLGDVRGPVRAKSGSGDLQVGRATADVVFSTGSGSAQVRRIERGRLQFKAGSGGLRVGVPAGVPVWTDVSSSSGRVRSELTGVGAPAAGQEHVEIRAVTHSGDIVLVEDAPKSGSDHGAVKALERP